MITPTLLATWLSDAGTGHDITINIENDQTGIKWSSEPIYAFLQDAKSAGVEIGYVYDLGNCALAGDAVKSAELLAPYTDYV